VEFVALPGTVFTVNSEVHQGDRTVYRVSSDDYPYPTTKGYYLDSRTVRPEAAKPAERSRSLPEKGAIIAAMKKRLGSGYVWGGNSAEGVRDRWGSGRDPVLVGLDCSGLLYEATGGYTPRNTSALVRYGRGVAIAGKGASGLARELRPLDLIVWPGHVLIVIDGGNVIESRLVCGNPREGVRIRPLQAALTEIMGKRRPADSIVEGSKEFVVRRWYGEGE
jgi:cell wall-associated NlpC family hydrolase